MEFRHCCEVLTQLNAEVTAQVPFPLELHDKRPFPFGMFHTPHVVCPQGRFGPAVTFVMSVHSICLIFGS